MQDIIKGNYGTMYYVADMKKSCEYYKTVFGLKARFEDSGWTEFDLGDGTALCLHAIGDKKPALLSPILIVKVKNIKTLVPELQKKGVEFPHGVKEVHPGAFAAEFKDPSGNMVSLYESPY